MRSLHVIAGLIVFISFQSYSQQLIINEVSQGSGSEEYVELLVIGNPGCQTPALCMDLRGVILDDNNGYFASGSGTGIAAGAIRFANNAFWSCIPQGTLIVIYSNTDRNPAIPPDDLSMNDGNCRLIIPINSNLIEGQNTSPTSANATYPAAGTWVAGSGNWNQVAMSNTNDSFLILSGITATTPVHGVSWGNNSTNAIIYFSGAAGGKVFSMTNNTNNDPFLQTNWTSGNVGVNETPGAANNTANSAWIASMNPQCGITTGIQVSINATPTGCGGSCSGTVNTVVSGGTAPYTYSWSNGATTANLSTLCAGTYTVVVSDAGGCSMTAQAIVTNTGSTITIQTTSTNESCQNSCDGTASGTITGGTAPFAILWSNGATTASISNLCPGTYTVAVTDNAGCSASNSSIVSVGTPIQDASIQTTGPFSTTDSPVQFTANSSGGSWSSDCGTCISTSGLFNPQSAGAGTYQICYTVGSGACSDQDCQTIFVTGCMPQSTSEAHSICPGDVYTFNGQNFSVAGVYPFVFTDQNGCDSTHTLNLSVFAVNPTSQSLTGCEGDSLFFQGNWYSESDNVVTSILDGNGCPTTHTLQIIFEDCSIEDYAVFIPNVFTPNYDNVNDFFSISIMGGFLTEGFIMNRWGNIVKEFYETDLKWDGRTNEGLIVPDGVYTYVFVVTNNQGAKTRYNGFVTMIR